MNATTKDKAPWKDGNFLGNQGDGPAATWLTDAMHAIGNAPAGFRNTFSRLMEAESVASPSFRQMMEDEVEPTETITHRVAAGSN